MLGSIPALLAGIGGLTEMVGHFTQNRELLKIGGVASMAGGTLEKMDGMLSAGKAGKESGLGILGKTTEENFHHQPGSALDSVLKGNFPTKEKWGSWPESIFDSDLLKKGKPIGGSTIPDIATATYSDWFGA